MKNSHPLFGRPSAAGLPAVTYAPYKSESRRHDRVCKPRLTWKAATPLSEQTLPGGVVVWKVKFLSGKKEVTIVRADECRAEGGREALRKKHREEAEVWVRRRAAELVVSIGRMGWTASRIKIGLECKVICRCGWGNQFNRVLWTTPWQHENGAMGPGKLTVEDWLKRWGFKIRQMRDDSWRIKRPGLKQEHKADSLEACVEWAKRNFPKILR